MACTPHAILVLLQCKAGLCPVFTCQCCLYMHTCAEVGNSGGPLLRKCKYRCHLLAQHKVSPCWCSCQCRSSPWTAIGLEVCTNILCSTKGHNLLGSAVRQSYCKSCCCHKMDSIDCCNTIMRTLLGSAAYQLFDTDNMASHLLVKYWC